jgi:hypothetical protein
MRNILLISVSIIFVVVLFGYRYVWFISSTEAEKVWIFSLSLASVSFLCLLYIRTILIRFVFIINVNMLFLIFPFYIGLRTARIDAPTIIVHLSILFLYFIVSMLISSGSRRSS